ncbi:sensor histidine kinase [Jannaschia sp. W003]|uniref:sensor histidine kinase n=1 Tax=Jannaschia sp. W003 TaxID=2867012 RepID=UPI0021A2FE5C|nr:sensor histidine kinase [Jannaschia sp. W003]UWQ22458.1 sensor histidine kinase [Jannaschia sp. W003]
MLEKAWRQRSLTLRVLLLLSLALMPLGAIGFWQTQRLSAEAPRQAKAALLSLTELAANPLQAAVQRGVGAAQALAPTVVVLRDDPAACSEFLADFLARSQNYSFAAFVRTDGILECSSNGERVDISGLSAFQEIVRTGNRGVFLEPDPPYSGTPVLAVVEALREAGGEEIVGFLVISIPERTMELTALGADEDRPFSMLIFNSRGDLLTSGQDVESARTILPVGETLRSLAGGLGRSFIAVDGAGRERVYAIVPIVPDLAYALSSWPQEMLAGSRFDDFVLTALMPVLMWLASLLVAFLALERLLFRHIRTLGRQMRAFARTRRTVRTPMLAGAGTELSQIEADFRDMAQAIMQDEAQLEDHLREKNILLKEVHHRVKNNLQLISSIMNMQMRKIASPEARDVLRRVQDRVMGLAAVHRSLYQTEDIGRIDAAAMVSDLAGQITASASGDVKLDFRADTERVEMDPDRAVALSLTVSEVMTNAVAHAARLKGAAETPWIRLDLRPVDDDRARLRVSNACAPGEAGAPPEGETVTAPPRGEAGGAATGGLGMQLVRAFAHQLDGEISIDQRTDSFVLDLTFPIETHREGPRDY